MRYTKSSDGVERATHWIPIRLERAELAAAKRLAVQHGNGNWHASLTSIADLAIENELDIFILEEQDAKEQT